MVESPIIISEDTIPTGMTSESDANDDVNILLMGPSGVGKTTFINAFVNYLKFDSLKLAEAGEMEVLIPSSFSLSGTGVDMDFEDQTIKIGGNANQYEHFSTEGQSATQLCRSFVFRIGNRLLRLIDTPGVADCRGIEQDTKNVQDMLAFIAQYHHLNAICMLLKPNEERLTVTFQYCVKEMLRHLHITAKENLMFLLTNARSCFYRPGRSKRLLEIMFEDHRKTYNVDIKITPQNTFLFDNEAFRYLAIRKNDISLDEYQSQSYEKSWEQSVAECLRLVKYAVERPKHYVQRMVSLNAAQQLIQKLPRPVAEITKLIEENIQLAQEFQRRAGQNPETFLGGIPQNMAKVHQFTHPRAVCASEKCTRVVEQNGERRVEYRSICHDKCYLKGVVQERLKHPNLRDCEEMNWETGNCLKCGCHWQEHIHITYQFVADRSYHRAPVQHTGSATAPTPPLTLEDVRRHIDDLRHESEQVLNVYKQLVEFLQANAILPVNDGFAEYLSYFIKEEANKGNTNERNSDFLSKLEQVKNQHEEHLARLKATLKERAKPDDFENVLNPSEIFHLVNTLYALPINGSLIREQVEKIQTVERETTICRDEHRVTMTSQENPPIMIDKMRGILAPS